MGADQDRNARCSARTRQRKRRITPTIVTAHPPFPQCAMTRRDPRAESDAAWIDAVLKAMFRPRGETSRIDIADALGRHFYRDRGLGTEFEMGVSAVRYSLKIRNQYAHCVWYDDKSGKLAFVNLEEVAGDNARLNHRPTGTLSVITQLSTMTRKGLSGIVPTGVHFPPRQNSSRTDELSLEECI
jgi:hypothetical protein